MKRTISFFALTLVFIFVFLGLGTWQLQRKGEKETLIETLTKNQKAPPQNVDSTETPAPFTPLYGEGHFISGKRIFLQVKTYQGKNGVYVLDVFRTNKGKFLLIQRGWAPKEITSPFPGDIKVEGMTRFPSPPNAFQPNNQKPTYFWIDIKALSRDLNLPLLPYYLVAKTSGDAQIYPTPPVPSLSNHHLQYAITWYSLAFFLLLMLLWNRKGYFKKESS